MALFAIACGLAVANVYYAHPLLDTIAADFGIAAGSAGILVTVTPRSGTDSACCSSSCSATGSTAAG